MDREKNVGGFLGETFSLARDAAPFLLIFIVIVGGINAMGVSLGFIESTNQIVGLGGSVAVTPETSLVSALYQLAAAIISIVGSYFLLAKLLDTRGRFGDGGTRIWAYIGLTILSVLGIIVGFVLIIIPGIMLLVRWSASSGFLIGSGKGVVESMGASWGATSGYSWPIFFAGLVMIIMLFVFGAVLGGAASASGSFHLIGMAGSIAEAAGNAISLCFGIAVYTMLHSDDHGLEQVFE